MDRRRRALSASAISGGGGIIDNYLTIVALEDGLTAKLSTNACEYCVDGDGNWLSLASGTTTQSVNTGHTLSFRGNLTPTYSGIGTFTISKSCNLEGNCMSMLFGDEAANNNSLEGKDYAFYYLFRHCSTIKSVSEGFLPATTLAIDCYGSMFQGCTSLTQAPELPATTLASSCYDYMFSGCTSLTQAPELPATTLASSCYDYMFSGCTSLTQAPELPATTLAGDCYYMMFSGCTSLTQAPELPATNLKDGCYRYMFNGCTSLTQAPALPATTLTYACYSSMFQGCTSLTQAPELPATTLASYCYQYMFYGCTSLTQAPELPATNLKDGCYEYMFCGTNVLPDCSNINFSKEAVGLKGLFAGTKVTDSDLERILPKNSNGKYCLPSTSLISYSYESMFRDCTSLITAPELPATTLATYCYSSMFQGCTSLTQAPELPATTLASDCYQYMFYGCTSLTQAPELPATNLKDGCYYMMFCGTNVLPDCSNINFSKKAVGLNGLFAGTKVTDSDLERILPKNSNGKYCLPSTSLISYSYESMFRDCTSLITAPELPATDLKDYCYRCMFQGCTNLIHAPELPATTLAGGCYQYMFRYCSKLNYIKAMFTTTPSTSYTFNWVQGVASTGTFVKNPDATWNVTGTHGIPSGWSVQSAAQ